MTEAEKYFLIIKDNIDVLPKEELNFHFINAIKMYDNETKSLVKVLVNQT
tara:strand:- start:3107 stop:3256 length:150 start_codon:yes stop_codon:yes gene_type:complete